MRRLRYWEEVGLVVPSIKHRLSDHNTVRLYSYQDLLALARPSGDRYRARPSGASAGRHGRPPRSAAIARQASR